MDQYQHSGYNNSMPQQSGYSNNGYGQSYGNNAAPVSYPPPADYDHSASGGYQDYKWVICLLILKSFHEFLWFLAPRLTHLMIPATLKGILRIIGSRMANRLNTDKLHKTRLPTRPGTTDTEIMVSDAKAFPA